MILQTCLRFYFSRYTWIIIFSRPWVFKCYPIGTFSACCSLLRRLAQCVCPTKRVATHQEKSERTSPSTFAFHPFPGVGSSAGANRSSPLINGYSVPLAGNRLHSARMLSLQLCTPNFQSSEGLHLRFWREDLMLLCSAIWSNCLKGYGTPRNFHSDTDGIVHCKSNFLLRCLCSQFTKWKGHKGM